MVKSTSNIKIYYAHLVNLFDSYRYGIFRSIVKNRPNAEYFWSALSQIWTEYRDLQSTLSAQTMSDLSEKISGVDENVGRRKINAEIAFTDKINLSISPSARKYGPEKTPHLYTFHH